jgi:hypothetical protein
MLATGAAASLAVAPAAIGDPSVDQSAADVIAQLTDEGYDVQINWVRGLSRRPLSECTVTGIHNPNRSGGPVDTFTTAYVDVSCPDYGDYDLGGGFGFGFGFG